MLEPEDVARGMLAVCCDEERYASGTVLEVMDVEKKKWRGVMMLNDPGPQGKAIIASREEEGLVEVVAVIEREKHLGK